MCESYPLYNWAGRATHIAKITFQRLTLSGFWRAFCPAFDQAELSPRSSQIAFQHTYVVIQQDLLVFIGGWEELLGVQYLRRILSY